MPVLKHVPEALQSTCCCITLSCIVTEPLKWEQWAQGPVRDELAKLMKWKHFYELIPDAVRRFLQEKDLKHPRAGGCPDNQTALRLEGLGKRSSSVNLQPWDNMRLL